MVELSKKISTIVGKTNAEYGLIKEGDRILVGFSGGVDFKDFLLQLEAFPMTIL